MADVSREAITAYALGRLTDPKFRQRLQATTAGGDRPIVPVLPRDLLAGVWDQIHACGDAGNVLMPFGTGFLIVAMTLEPVEASDREPSLRDDCTMGLFVARLLEDGGWSREVVYRMAEGVFEEARADLVGVAE